MPAFISHSHEDQSAYSSLRLALDGSGVPRWDVSQLSPGHSLAEQLRCAIEHCDVCIFLATRRSLQSKWCLAELGAFWGAGKRVMVYLADPEVKEADLPPQFQGDLWTADAEQLVSAIKEVLNKSARQIANTAIELRTRDRLPNLHEQAGQASEITLIGASLVSLVISCQTFFQYSLKRGCKLRFVVLDPNCTAVEAWNLRTESGSGVVKHDIERVMINFRLLAQYAHQDNQLDIRLLPTFPPYSIICVDPDKDSGWMIVELHDYKRSLGERGHLFIRKETSPYWHSHYLSILEQICGDAVLWQTDLNDATT